MPKEDKIKIIIYVDPVRVGSQFKIGRETIRWEEFTREEQVVILNNISATHDIFRRFLKEED